MRQLVSLIEITPNCKITTTTNMYPNICFYYFVICCSNVNNVKWNEKKMSPHCNFDVETNLISYCARKKVFGTKVWNGNREINAKEETTKTIKETKNALLLLLQFFFEKDIKFLRTYFCTIRFNFLPFFRLTLNKLLVILFSSMNLRENVFTFCSVITFDAWIVVDVG